LIKEIGLKSISQISFCCTSLGDYADGLHPNAGGYEKMARARESGDICGLDQIATCAYSNSLHHRVGDREKLGIGDVARADLALESVKGKRLTYETTRSPRPAQLT
jgi:hypothetical protein